jgi:hypothetical protein
MRRRIFLIAGWLFPLVVAVLFFAKGQKYDAAYFEPPVPDFSALPVPSEVGEWVLEGGAMLPADRMFEKINGKAAYYHQYGATGLCSGEWVASGQRWDMYLYSFAEGQGARGAYSGERPSDGVAIEGVEGYTVPGQAAMTAGQFYLQLNAQTANADAGVAAALALELGMLLGGTAEESTDEAGIDLAALAADDNVGGGEEFLPESAFGFSVLNNVRTIKVSLAGTETVWFTAPGDAETVSAYAEELAMYGGENLFSQNSGSGGSMFGSWEFAGLVDGAVWGIHNAPSREALLQHWEALRERVHALLETP